MDHRHDQRAGAVLALDVDRQAEADGRRARRAAACRPPRRSEWPITGKSRAAWTIAQAIRWVNESFLPAALSSLRRASSTSTGQRAEARGGGDRAALVHEAGERGRRAADRLELGRRRSGGARRRAGRAVALDRARARPPWSPARAGRCPRRRRRRSRGRSPSARPPGWRSRRRCRAAAAGAVACGRLGGRLPAGRARRGAVAPAAIRQRTVPTATVSSASARISVSVPATGEGSSASTLSVEISTSVSSTATASPDLLRHSSTVPSATESPISGKATSTSSASALGLGRRRRPSGAVGARPRLGRRAAVRLASTSISPSAAPTCTVSSGSTRIFDERARGGRGHLGVDLVGGDLDQRLVGVDAVAHLLQPLEDRALGDRLAHLGHGDLNGRCRVAIPSLQLYPRREPCRRVPPASSPMAGGCKHWGWGYEDQQPSHEEVAAGRGRRRREHLGFGPAEVERPAPLEDVELPAPRLEPPAVARRDLPQRRLRARLARLRQVLPRRGAGLPRALRPPAGRGRAPARRGRARGACSTGAPRRAPRRSRSAAARAWWAASSRALADGYAARSRSTCAARPRARGRPGLARGAHPGRRHRPRPRGAAARARPDAAPLPAVVRVLDARRLDRHARGRPLRDARSPTSTTSSSRCARSPRAASGRAGACPARAPGRAPTGMLIGSEGMLGVITEAWVRVQERAALQGVGRRCCSTASRRARGGARARAVGALPVELPAARPGRGRADRRGAGRPGAARARLRVGRPPARRVARARALELCRDHGGERASETATATSEGAWRDAFLQAPYLRDTLVAAGILSETFETAITWDRFDDVRARACASARARRARRGHASPAGSRTSTPTARRPTSPCSRRRGAAPSSSSGTRSRRPPPRRSSAPAARSRTTTPSAATTGPGTTASARTPFADGAARRQAAVDPAGILNPGVLIDSTRGVSALSAAPAGRPLAGASSRAPTASCRASGGCACRCPGRACRT